MARDNETGRGKSRYLDGLLGSPTPEIWMDRLHVPGAMLLPTATLRCPLSDERGNGKGERDSPAGGQGGSITLPRSGHRLNQSLPDWSPQSRMGDRDEQKPTRFLQRTD